MTAAMSKFYTLKDLEELTGFDGRTIYFYVQEGLVPKLGRRGRTSQYPQAFLDRLLFIKQLKALQDSGEISPITLRDIRAILHSIPPETVARVAAGDEPLQAIDLETEWTAGSAPEPETHYASTVRNKPEGMTDAQFESSRFMITHGALSRASSREAAEEADDPGEWTTLSVTDDILLTVRGRDAKARPLVQKLVRMIRSVVGKG